MPSTINPQLSSAAANARRWLRRLGWLVIFCGALLAAGYLFRAPFLTGLADAWVVNDPVAKADAIVVLGGGPETRPFAAARLYRDGVAPMVLYTDVRAGPATELGITPREAELTHRILLSNGVPETAMTLIGTNVASTYDESRAVRDWDGKTGAKSIVIPTDPFHTRRVRWIFGKELRGTKTAIHVVPVNPTRYRVKDWWRHEEGVIAFQNEVLKYVYYRFEY
jgi:uncharacterized SAM-binding protein YcdF (DUF218 family)